MARKELPKNPSLQLQQSLLTHPEENATGYVAFENASDKANRFEPNATQWSRVNAWWLADASWIAYSHDATSVAATFAKAGLPTCVPLAADGTEGYAAHNADFAIVTFRGTQPDDWNDIFNIIRFIPSRWDVGVVHKGFEEAFDDVFPQLETALKTIPATCKIWLTGHSLGGALASLAAARLRGRAHGLYTFGSPRVGDAAFAAHIGEFFDGRSIRYVNDHDIVTHVPPPGFALPRRYTHVDSLRSINKDGQVSDARPRLDHFFEEVFGNPALLLDLAESSAAGRARVDLPDALADHTPLYYALHTWNDFDSHR